MANIRLSNTYYIDAASGELATRNLKVKSVVVTATGATGRLVLSDSTLGVKLDLRVAVSGDSILFDFSNAPVVFSTSIKPTTLSNAVATVIIEETNG